MLDEGEPGAGQGNPTYCAEALGEAVNERGRGGSSTNPDLSAAVQPALDRENFSGIESYSILSLLQECHA
jgi:hypothetical protein